MTIGGYLGAPVAQLPERDVDSSRYRPSGHLVGLAHVEEIRFRLGSDQLYELVGLQVVYLAFVMVAGHPGRSSFVVASGA
jgi:hypothetical protein